mmetsp:Transcript_111274/g.314078  ORF Transcript_111274/g.314078 Transcript_111274/m.314078 type:complete len:318 (-) Transcript_111274:201-1154(-)
MAAAEPDPPSRDGNHVEGVVHEAAEESADEHDAPAPHDPAWMQARDDAQLRVDGLDFYALLGVAQDATMDDLRRAYKEQARLCHPDKAGAAATARFQAIAEAFETLTEPRLRVAYDGLLAHFPPPRPTAAELHPTGFQDVEPFRAAPSDLRALATFRHRGETWVPKELGDMSWQRPLHDAKRVRLVFSAGYPRRSDVCSELTSPAARGQLHDAVAFHLAEVLVMAGWRSEDTADAQLLGEGEGTCAQGGGLQSESLPVVARHRLLGPADTSTLSSQLGTGELAAVVRFAVEGVPKNLRVLFQAAQTMVPSKQACVQM